MIDSGRIVFQGAIAGLIAGQQADIVARPEHPADAQALVDLCIAAGKPARLDGEDIHVQASEEWAAELNRTAMAAGITLRGLAVARASLEQAFFAITEGEQEQESAD